MHNPSRGFEDDEAERARGRKTPIPEVEKQLYQNVNRLRWELLYWIIRKAIKLPVMK